MMHSTTKYLANDVVMKSVSQMEFLLLHLASAVAVKNVANFRSNKYTVSQALA